MKYTIILLFLVAPALLNEVRDDDDELVEIDEFLPRSYQVQDERRSWIFVGGRGSKGGTSLLSGAGVGKRKLCLISKGQEYCIGEGNVEGK